MELWADGIVAAVVEGDGWDIWARWKVYAASWDK